MAISQFFVLSQRGDSIISRDFRGGELPRGTAEIFFRHVSGSSFSGLGRGGRQPGGRAGGPVFSVEGVRFYSVKKSGLFFVATAASGAGAEGDAKETAEVLELVSRVVRVFKDFAGSLSEETIRKQFPLFYEILDEAIDFGFIQTTATQNLRLAVRSNLTTGNADGDTVPDFLGGGGELGGRVKKFEQAAVATISNFVQNQLAGNATASAFIQQLPEILTKQLPANLLSAAAAAAGGGSGSGGQTQQHQQAKTMSSAAVAKPLGAGGNEIFVDIVEKLNFVGGGLGGGLGGFSGELWVEGGIYVKSFLAGCPGISLGVETGAGWGGGVFSVHEQADAELFERQRVIALGSTPEGECRLLGYRRRLQRQAEPPMRLVSVVAEVEKERLDLTIRLLAAGVPETAAVTNMEVTCTLTGRAHAVTGNGELARGGRAVVWRVKKLVGGQETSLRAKIHHSGAGAGGGGVFRAVGVAVNFEISMFTLGGVEVKQLKVDGFSNPNRWVRYVTQATNYTFRL